MTTSLFLTLRQNRFAIMLITAVFIIAGSTAYFTFGSPLMESRQGRLFLSRILVVCIALYGVLLLVILRDYFLRIVKEFFRATAHPINLAVFRIVVFCILLFWASRGFSRIVWYSQVPPEFRIAPVGLKWILDVLPINETWATIACALLLVFSFTAMIGFFTRTSAWITVITGVYALGIPELFGKVDHYHHLVWFPAILAASRCGDVFSVDAIFGAWRRADHGITDPPEASNAYALPLRFVWLLMGIMYFFPGFAKLWICGFDWALSENIKFMMYDKWDYPDGWMPFFRIDQYPVLYKLGGLATIVFEVSFLFLIFFPRLRFLAVAGGFAFHTMTELFLRISFRELLRCYVVFFDWNMIFRRLGGWIYREQMSVIYDGNCSRCRRTIAFLRVFDIFGRLTYVNAHDRQSISDLGLLWLDSSVMMTDICVAGAHRNSWTGFFAYRILAARIPILWPILPLLYVWPIPAIGTRLYRHVADSRTCSIVPYAKTKAFNPNNAGVRPIVTVGVILLGANIVCALGGVTKSWPFAVYPTFATMVGEKTLEKKTTRTTIAMTVLTSAAENRSLDALARKPPFPRHYTRMIERILKTQDDTERHALLKALWQLWVQNDLTLRQVSSVGFYKVSLWTIPERYKENPIQQELLLELYLNETSKLKPSQDGQKNRSEH